MFVIDYESKCPKVPLRDLCEFELHLRFIKFPFIVILVRLKPAFPEKGTPTKKGNSHRFSSTAPPM